MGRRHSHDPKCHVVSARLTDAQFISLAERAHKTGKTVADHIHALIVDGHDRPVAKLPCEARAPLITLAIKTERRDRIDALGRDLNSLAHAINAYNLPPASEMADCLNGIGQCVMPLVRGLMPMTNGNRIRLRTQSYLSLNRIAVNLRQIASRLDGLGLPVPDDVVSHWSELTALLDHADRSGAS